MAESNGEEATGLGDLPEACISAILSCMQSAQDVARLSCVNSTFAAAALSDAVWQALLPPGTEEIMEHALWDRPSPYDATLSPSLPLQQPAVHQIMGHLINGVHPGGIPGGRGRFRGRPLLLVPNPIPGRQNTTSANPVSAQPGPVSQHGAPGSGSGSDDNSPQAAVTGAVAGLSLTRPNSPMELFQRLARGVLLGEAGLESYRVDVSSGGVERMFSVRGAHVTWGNDPRYWQQALGHGSYFGASLLLMNVCWLEIRLLRRVTLPPGEYTVLWRLAIRQPGPWVHPAQLSVTTGDGVTITKAQSFAYGDYLVRPANTHEWTELEVGVISVKHEGGAMRASDGGRQSGGVEVELDCIIREIEGGHWKSGLDVDCMIIRPRKVQQAAGRSEVSGVRTLASKAQEPLAELAETAKDMGTRFVRWISGRQ